MRLSLKIGGYFFAKNAKTTTRMPSQFNSRMSINLHFQLASPEGILQVHPFSFKCDPQSIEMTHSWLLLVLHMCFIQSLTNEWCRKLLLRLLDVRPHFREGFRIASANTAAASANASSKNLLPRASAAPFLSYFLQYRFREQSASFREACGNRKYVDFEFRYEWMIYVEVAGLCHTHSFLDHLPQMVRSHFRRRRRGEEEAGESDSAES